MIKGYHKYTLPQPFDITDMRDENNEKSFIEGKEEFEKLKQ